MVSRFGFRSSGLLAHGFSRSREGFRVQRLKGSGSGTHPAVKTPHPVPVPSLLERPWPRLSIFNLNHRKPYMNPRYPPRLLERLGVAALRLPAWAKSGPELYSGVKTGLRVYKGLR